MSDQWKKIITGALWIAPLLALFFLIASKDEALGTSIVVDPSTTGGFYHGDLYSLDLLNYFKENITVEPQSKTLSTTSVGTASYIVMGDSFFGTGYDSPTVNSYIESVFGKGSVYAPACNDATPYECLKANNYKKGPERVLIVETVERLSYDRAVAMEGDSAAKVITTSAGSSTVSIEANNSFLHRSLQMGESTLSVLKPDRVRVEYVIKNNFLVAPIRTWLKNKDFEWFGDIDGATPLYSLSPRMLFLDDDVTFHNDTSKTAEIPKLADGIAREATLLKQTYNVDLVYVLIPDKLTLYYPLLKGEGVSSYDQYVPELQKAVADKGVSTVDVYDLYTSYIASHPNELLYYGGDTHYDPLGKTLLEGVLIKELNKIRG